MTRNEERVITRTLKSVADFDQVFVVDSHSEDSTCALAKDLGAEVVHFTWDGRYPKKKEWCLLNLPFEYDWVLYLDADESVTPGVVGEFWELFSADPSSSHAAYDIRLDYFFLGRMLRHGHKAVKRALVDRRRVTWPHPDDLGVTNMWEVEGHYQPTVEGSVGRLTSRLEHNDIDPLFDYFSRHNRYSDWEAAIRDRPQQDVNSLRSLQGRIWSRVPMKPLAFFIYGYVLRGGFLDGRAGLHFAVANSFYYWQINVKRIAAVGGDG
jgi:glycosyltransferase involved in cell wall biosynthesis